MPFALVQCGGFQMTLKSQRTQGTKAANISRNILKVKSKPQLISKVGLIPSRIQKRCISVGAIFRESSIWKTMPTRVKSLAFLVLSKSFSPIYVEGRANLVTELYTRLNRQSSPYFQAMPFYMTIGFLSAI